MAQQCWVGLVCSAICIFLVVRQVDWSRTLATLQTVDWFLVCLGVGAIVVAYVVFALRWRVLLAHTIWLPGKNMFSYTMIGYLANTVLPLRLGEVVRTVLLGKRHQISLSLVFGSVVLERTLDVLVILFVTLGISCVIDIPPAVRAAMVSFAGAGLAALVALVLLARIGKRFSGWVTKLPIQALRLPAERLVGLVEHFAKGLSILQDGRQLGVVLIFSIMIWGIAGAGTMAYIAAFHLSTPWYAGFFVLAIANLGAAIPSSPSAIGVYHYAVVMALSVWGTEKSVALGYAVATHGIAVFLNLLIGSACLVREGLTWRTLGAMSDVSAPVLTKATDRD